jgi:putative transcriptional regulator
MRAGGFVLGTLLAATLGSSAFSSPQNPRRHQRRPESLAPDKGIFLVAKPSIAGGPFHQSVVLLVAHEKGGTLGLIVNRATDIPFAEALPDLKATEKDPPALFFGGPVVLNALMFLFRSDKPPEDTNGVMGDVYFSSNRQALEKLLKQKTASDRLRLYLGHSGWAPGQLEGEIERGDWELVRADPETVFQSNLDEMWPELLEQAQGTMVARARSTERSIH